MRRNAGGITDDGFSRLASFLSAADLEDAKDEPEEEKDSDKGGSDKDLKQELVEFLKDNPNPEDELVHEWAEENGYEVDEIESLLYELATDYVESNDPDSEDLIPGGKADDVPDEDLPMEQLLKGIKVEMEHTDDPDVAKEIASDHIEEFPDGDYYDALAEMEDELKSKKGGREDWPPHPYGAGWGSCSGCGQDVEDLPPGELCDTCSRWKTIEDEKRQEREQGYQDDLLDQVRGRSCR